MPGKGGRFTDQERAFAEAYVSVRDPQKAALLAGYKSPASGYQALDRPAVMAEIQKISSRRLHGELVPLALDHLANVLRPDSKDSTKDKTQAATVVLRHASAAGAEAAGGKQISELTYDELCAQIERIRAEADARAKTIDGTAVSLDETREDDLFA